MSGPKVFIINGNEDIKNQSLIIENLVHHRADRGKKCLIVSLANTYFPEVKPAKETKNRFGGIFRFYGEKEIPFAHFDALLQELKNEKRKTDILGIEKEISEIYIIGNIKDEFLKFYELLDHVILILKSSSDMSGYLYFFLEKFSKKAVEKKISLIFTDEKKIEEAAVNFYKLSNEMHTMIGEHTDLNFLGSIFFDLNKIVHSKHKNGSLIKVFPDDPFHGCIKYINERADKLEGAYYEKTFFERLAEFDFGGNAVS